MAEPDKTPRLPALSEKSTTKDVLRKVMELENRLIAQEDLAFRTASLIDSIEKRVKANEIKIESEATRLDTATIDVNNTKTKVGDIEESVNSYDEDINKLKEVTSKLQVDFETYAERFLKSDNLVKRRILVLEGLPEDTTGSLRDVLDQLFNDVGLKLDNSTAESIYRRGRKPQPPPPGNPNRANYRPRPRPVVIHFSSAQYKNKIFANINKLKGNDDWYGVHLTDDISLEEKNFQRDLRSLQALDVQKMWSAQ